MYAVVSSGGKQYRVEAGTTLTVERIGAEAGAAVTFDRVLLIGDGEAVTVGTPTVAGASVSATVLGEELGPKLVIFKFKQKVKYRRRTGHRQHLVRVRIDAINPDASSRARAKAKPEADASPAADEAPKPRARRAKAEASDKPEAVEAAAAEAPKPRARRAKAEASAPDEKPAAKPRVRKPRATAEE
jgi:large subunit ribosomal protein L21